MELDPNGLSKAAEAAHYAQGFDDYGVANSSEVKDATDIARAVIAAYLDAVKPVTE